MNALLCVLAVTLGSRGDHVTLTIFDTNAGFFSAKSEVLEFKPSVPMTSLVNSTLMKRAKNAHSSWVKSVKETQKDIDKPAAEWEYESSMKVSWRTPKLVSVLISKYEYSGGAHPNHGVEVANFGIVGGKPKSLTLSDFFSPGFNAKTFVSKAVVAKLKKAKGAEWVQSGQLKQLEPQMLERFTPSATGLTWYFNPYDVGPYAAGDFEVKLNLSELGPKFKKTMLAAR